MTSSENGVRISSGVFSLPLEPLEDAAFWPRRTRGQETLLRQYICGDENILLASAGDDFLRRADYQPFVLLGAAGTGKTALAATLAALWKKENPDARIRFVAGSDFTRGVSRATETNSLEDFKATFRRLGLFVLDDIQQLAGAPVSQEIFLSILDARLKKGRPLLVTSRTWPGDVSGLSAGLASRLVQGLTIPLAPVGHQGRAVLLQKLLTRHQLSLDDEAFALLVAGLQGHTAPEIDAALALLKTASAGLEPGPLSAAVVKKALADHHRLRMPSLRTIASRVAKHFRVKTSDLKGPTRRREVVAARGVAMYLARQLTGASLQRVGDHFGGRDHTTVLHACRTTSQRLEQDRETQRAVARLSEQLIGGEPS